MNQKEKKLLAQDRANFQKETDAAPDRLDRIRAFYWYKRKLSPADEGYHQTLLEVATMLRDDSMIQSRIINSLTEKKGRWGYARQKAYKVYHDALALFGDMSEASKEGEKAVLSERYLRLAEIAEEKGDIQLASQILEKYSKLRGLDKTEEEKERKQAPFIIHYTTDPEALKRIEEQKSRDEAA